MVPDFEFFAARMRHPVSSNFPAKSANQCFVLSQMGRSRRAQLLSCAKSNKQCEPETKEFVDIFKNKKILVVTLDTLDEKLNYLESSLIEWHTKRGLPEQYTAKKNLIVISSEDRDEVRGYKQEIFEYETEQNR